MSMSLSSLPLPAPRTTYHALLRGLPARAALVLAAVLLIAVQALAQSTKPLKPVKIALGTQVVNVTYPWLTLPIALGYWRDEGYDVQVVTVGGSLQGIQQLVAGGVEFAQVNSTGLIQANADQNVPVRGLMGTGTIDWGVGVLADGPIKSVTDLKGKKIGIFSLGTGGAPLLKGYLRSNGIDPDKDVQIIATGAGAPALEARRADRVQALMPIPPWSRPSRAALPRLRCSPGPTPTAHVAFTGRPIRPPSPPAPTSQPSPSGT
jgi:NitT/TauT family transport system substrate-binding protein